MARRALTVMAACIALGPGAAHAATGPCVVGSSSPSCHVWTAKVQRVNDGDTLEVDLQGDGTSRDFKVRLAGIQAMELRRYARNRRRGECQAVAATRLLERMVRRGHGRVRLSALNQASFGGRRQRLRRSVALRRRGRWVDAGSVLVRRGLALWLASGREWAPNRRYSRLAAEAAAKGRGLWSGRACGRGPAQSSSLQLRIKWDAAGRDNGNVNGEWVRIGNPDPARAVSLRGWWLRDSSLRRYRFPASASIPPAGYVWVLVGRGEDTPTRFHWGRTRSIFQNATGGRRAVGDGAYLFDPDGDLRSGVQYPCRRECSEPLADKVSLSAAYRTPEYVTIRNTSAETVSLADYELESVPWFYTFRSDAQLPPGRALVLWIEDRPFFLRGFPVRLVSVEQEWGFGHPLLSSRDAVTLRNPLGAPVACDSWGGYDCPDA